MQLRCISLACSPDNSSGHNPELDPGRKALRISTSEHRLSTWPLSFHSSYQYPSGVINHMAGWKIPELNSKIPSFDRTEWSMFYYRKGIYQNCMLSPFPVSTSSHSNMLKEPVWALVGPVDYALVILVVVVSKGLSQ